MTHFRSSLIAVVLVALSVVASPARAVKQVTREQDVTSIRLGQHILVDDGSCPAGQIKDMMGSKLTPAGIVVVKKCVPRSNRR